LPSPGSRPQPLPRLLHAHRRLTGREISRALLAARTRFLTCICARTRSPPSSSWNPGRSSVCRFIDELDGSLHELRAEAVLLATGASARSIARPTNSGCRTGDAMAIAYDAGAALSDMESCNFIPPAGRKGRAALPFSPKRSAAKALSFATSTSKRS